MAELEIQLLKSSVGHARLHPKKNSFKYKVFYVRIPILPDQHISTPKLFSFNKFNILSVFTKDHGAKVSEISWYGYIERELDKVGFKLTNSHTVELIALPRLFGYAFNPISYWLVKDGSGQLLAALCEVRNTFKQTHNYLLINDDRSSITKSNVMRADKHLYVSPFTKIEGHYEFKFERSDKSFKSVIDYFDDSGRQILNTYLSGHSSGITTGNVVKAVLSYPAMTALVVIRIHYQALRLYMKRVRQTLKHLPKDYDNNQTTKGGPA